MNSRVGTDSPKLAVPEAPQVEAEDARKQAERWLSVFVANVRQMAPVSSQTESTGGWRGSVGDLTAVNGGLATAEELSTNTTAPSTNTTVDSAESLTQSRMVVQVDAGELGQLNVVVDRSDLGVTLRFGVENQAAARALQAERGVLEQALAAQGLTLKSLTIVAAQGFGTVLAPDKESATERNQRTSRFLENQPGEAERRRSTRKLNLIG